MNAATQPCELTVTGGQHLLGAFIGDPSGPTLIAVGSLHGNEPAGNRALLQIAERLGTLEGSLKGRVYLITGNTRALPKNVRYIDCDLNRAWTRKNLASLRTPKALKTSECRELAEIEQMIDSILITARSEVYVLDLHSTSAAGEPFATVGDTLRNRSFAQRFPVTILLGIEEQLEGTMLEYLNNAGAVTLGFEGGSHASPDTIAKHTALVWLGLVNAGILAGSDVPDLDFYRGTLAGGKHKPRVVEVRYRQGIIPTDGFEMKRGFNNFDPIVKGQVLARSNFGPITAQETGLILMPLYQKLGEDGFFVGREVLPFWLKLSNVLRRAGLHRLMPWLPGVSADPDDPQSLLVDTRMARYFPLQIFHLLGYRRRRWIGRQLVVSRRKHDTQSPFLEEAA